MNHSKKRRQFLSQTVRLSAVASMGSTAVGSLLLSACSDSQAKAEENTPVKSKNPHVLIIGAGMAGLTAARQLHDAGIAVTIIEGRQRVGGRLHTSHEWPDLPMDLGASWIHGTKNNPITQLAQHYRAAHVPTQYESAKLYIASDLKAAGITDAELDSMEARVNRALKFAQKGNVDLSLQQAVDQELANKRISKQGMAQLNFYLNSKYEQEYAGEADELSAWTMDDNEVFDGDDVLFPKGYNQISDGLAQGLDIQTNHIVQSIDYSDAQSIQVKTNQKTFTGTHLIVTLPLGVLKANTVQFIPELPEDKRTAIAQLGMGLLNKHFLRFDKVFWDKSFDWHEYLHGEKGKWTEWVSFAKVNDTPVLLGFSAAKRARMMEKWTDAQIQAEAMEALRDMFGSSVPEPVAHQFTRWSQDPFAYGSYSFNAVGSGNDDRVALSRPIDNRVFWAGEACSSQYPGTVHGAHISGLDSVKALRKALKVIS
jgi:monoamine oxidase